MWDYLQPSFPAGLVSDQSQKSRTPLENISEVTSDEGVPAYTKEHDGVSSVQTATFPHTNLEQVVKEEVKILTTVRYVLAYNLCLFPLPAYTYLEVFQDFIASITA